MCLILFPEKLIDFVSVSVAVLCCCSGTNISKMGRNCDIITISEQAVVGFTKFSQLPRSDARFYVEHQLATDLQTKSTARSDSL